MKYVLRVEYDDSGAVDCPLDGECEWTLIPFDRRMRDNRDASEFFARSKDGDVIGANIGIRSKMRAGLAFALDCYEHGGRAYSLHGEGMRCQWDTSRFAGILLWNHPPKELGAKTYEAREASARAALQVYNQWANGEVYYFSVEDMEGECVDSCCGFYDAESIADHAAHNFKPGDTVKLAGNASGLISAEHFPGVNLVDEFDEEEEREEAEAWAARC